MDHPGTSNVIPAKAGIQSSPSAAALFPASSEKARDWTPAFAGVTLHTLAR